MAKTQTDKIMTILTVALSIVLLAYVVLYFIPGFYHIPHFFNPSMVDVEKGIDGYVDATPSLGYSIWVDTSYYGTYGYGLNNRTANEINYISDPVVISTLGALVIIFLSWKLKDKLITQIVSALWVLYVTFAVPLSMMLPIKAFNGWGQFWYSGNLSSYKLTSSFCVWEKGNHVIIIAIFALLLIADVLLIIRFFRFMKNYVAKKKAEAEFKKKRA